LRISLFGFLLVIFLTCVVIPAFNIKPAEAHYSTFETIFIRFDGSIYPQDAPIVRDGNLYTLTDDINVLGPGTYGIVIERHNITLDGAGHSIAPYFPPLATISPQSGRMATLPCYDPACGVTLLSNNVTIKRLVITNFEWGISIPSSDNVIAENTIFWCMDTSIDFGPLASNNKIYHNNLEQVNFPGLATKWDNGYPSGGNYWKDHLDVDLHCGSYQNLTGNDGIWDHSYNIDATNTDGYPLVEPYVSGNLSISIYADKATYHAGEIMHLGLNTLNPDSVKYVCFAVWCTLPDDSNYLYIHSHSNVLPIGLDFSNSSFRTITLSSLPRGQYIWHAAFLDRSTHKVIVEDKAEWQFS